MRDNCLEPACRRGRFIGIVCHEAAKISQKRDLSDKTQIATRYLFIVLYCMIPEQKIHEIRKQLRKGEPEGEIKEKLHSEGYSREEIDKVFLPHRYDMRSWYLFFAIVIGIAGLIILAKTGGLLILILSGLLFLAYFNEIQRLKRL